MKLPGSLFFARYAETDDLPPGRYYTCNDFHYWPDDDETTTRCPVCGLAAQDSLVVKLPRAVREPAWWEVDQWRADNRERVEMERRDGLHRNTVD